MQVTLVNPGPLIRIEHVWQEIVGVTWRVKFVIAASWLEPETRVDERVFGVSELSYTPVRVSIDMFNSS